MIIYIYIYIYILHRTVVQLLKMHGTCIILSGVDYVRNGLNWLRMRIGR